MSPEPLEDLVQHARALLSAETEDDRPDQELLRRFLDSRDERAFAALLRRHGPMVLGVCRRVLRHAQDAEDACQATFLLLTRQAAAIRKGTSLGSWLHSVAYRLSRKMASGQASRRQREAQAPPASPSTPEALASWREVQTLLDEELDRLPPKYRAPLVLCYLEGQTRDEAACQLRLSLSTLRGRLEQGRHLLRARLARRGVTLSGALLLPALADTPLPAPLVVATVRSSLSFAAGEISSRAATLAEGMLKIMTLNRVKKIAAVLLLGAVLTVGTGLLIAAAAPPRPADPSRTAAPPAGKAAAAAEPVLADEVGRAFLENDALVDEKFAGKRLRVTGSVGRVRRAGTVDRPRYEVLMQVLVVPQGLGVNGIDPHGNCLLCFEFDVKHRKELARLGSTPLVGIEGRCESRTSTERGKPVVHFRDCQLFELPADEGPGDE